MEQRAVVGFAAAQIITGAVTIGWIVLWPGPWDLHRWIGSGLILIGMCGIATARIQLGRSFSVTAQARKLVTHGIYSKIRNPIYFFGMIAIAGFVVLMRRPYLWPMFLAIAIVQIIRARKEAKVLESAFGEQYREYRRRTWF